MIRRRPTVALAALVLAGLVATACGDASADGGEPSSAPPAATVGGVGALPDPVSQSNEPIVVIRPPTGADGRPVELLAGEVDGNRVLLIGDSILASTSARYGDHMCRSLVPLGWRAQVEAEPSRFIEFGNRVLDRVLDDPEGWNAAVVFLGSNYNGDADHYARELGRILDRLAPRPTVLVTVTEYRANYAEVNETIRRLGDENDHVTVLDWRSIAETPGVLANDGLHLSDRGRQVLADAVAATLGQVTVSDGECLGSRFRDDSAVGSDRDVVLGTPTTPTPPRPPGIATTVPSTASTTVPTAPTVPTTTAPPVIDPTPTTAPPTNPPATTSPPVTTPPTTTLPPDESGESGAAP